MYETIDIYIAFRKAQAEANNRGYRIPKDFSKHLEKKMSEKNREALIKATSYFNTKWMNIDPYEFFSCGFEVFKNFTYTNFFDEKVMKLFKMKDKNKKREVNVSKASMKRSLKWVKAYISKNGISSVKEYCRRREGNVSLVVKHYMHNKVDKLLLVYFINKGVLILTDSDRNLIPYVVEQYRECLQQLKEMKKNV